MDCQLYTDILPHHLVPGPLSPDTLGLSPHHTRSSYHLSPPVDVPSMSTAQLEQVFLISSLQTWPHFPAVLVTREMAEPIWEGAMES